MPDLRLYFFGAPHIVCDGHMLHVDTRKATALLAYLALAGRPCRRESLISLLWPEADPEHGRGVLRRTLSVLHSAMACDGLAIERETVGLDGIAWCDVTEFQRLLATYRAGDVSPARLASLAEAAALYRDDFLSGFSLGNSLEFDDWQREQAGHLSSELGWALERLAQGYADQGQLEPAVAFARRWLGLDRLNEAAHCQLMRLYAWSGQRSLALRQYAECQAVLRQELDAAPQADTTALYTAIKENRLPASQTHVETQNFASLPPALAPRPAGKRFATLLAVETQPQAHLSIEEQAARLQDFSAAARVCLAAYGGQIVTIPGDRWLAVFGGQAAHESDPEMALRAALALQPEAGRLGLALSIGAATGEVYHQPEALRPVGETVRLAQALAMQAGPGEILASEATYHLTRGVFAFSSQALSTRNGSEPVNAYRVSTLLPQPQKAGGLGAPQVQMIGREMEFARLLEAFQRLQAGEGQIVTIVGEAGVGKSRLIDELRRAVVGHARWLEGRCLEWGQPASYWPFVDMLHAFFGENGQAVGAVLQDMCASGSLSAGRAAEIAELIGRLRPAGQPQAIDATSIEHLRQQTFLALRDFFLGLARQRPVVLVFEDLHWADPLSLDLIALLIESLPLGPLLLACVYRPEREHRCLRLGRIAAHKCPQRYTDLYLRELTYGQSQALLDALGRGEIPGRTKESILERTQGNPFFIEEMARSLLEGGGLPGEAPASVQSVIRSRLDHLEPGWRQVLEAASVVGRVFRRRVVERMMGQDINAALWVLEDRGLIFPERTFPEDEYSFKHVLTQEAVYGSLLQPQRAAYHRQAAGALEALYGDRPPEYAGVLAYHYERCGDPSRAAGCLLEAGRNALGAYDNGIAIAHLRHGLELLGQTPPSEQRDRLELELQVALGVPLVLVRGHGASEVGAVYERARQLCHGLGETPHLFQVLMGLRRYYFHHGHLLKARTLGEEMTSAAQDPLERSRACMMQGEVLLAQGEFRQAQACLQRGLALDDYNQAEASVLRYGNHTGIGLRMFDLYVNWMNGYADQARRQADQLLEIAARLAHPFSLACALYWTALLSLLLGDVAAVQEQAEALQATSTEHSFLLYGAVALTLQGWVLAEADRHEAGMALMRQGLDELEGARTIPFYTGGWAFLAEACGKAGRPQEGLQVIGEVEARIGQTGATAWQAEHLRLKGELLQQAGASPSEVEACYRQALELARSQAAKSWELRIATSAARFLCDQGREAEARHLLGEVYSWFTEGFETADLRRAKALLQELGL